MKRQQPLVTQHLENISRDALQKYQVILRDFVKNRQGIYALYRKNKLYYVGLASNLRSRLKSHLKDRHGASWDRFSVYLTIGDSHLRELEALILRSVKPTGNKQKGKFAKSEDLRRRIARALRTNMQLELDDLMGKVRVAPKAKPSRSAKKSDEGKTPVLAKLITRSFRIRRRYKKRMYVATVRRDGWIRFDGKLFPSPSAAGKHAVKKSCNGWTFWQFERSPGDWVQLSKLRK